MVVEIVVRGQCLRLFLDVSPQEDKRFIMIGRRGSCAVPVGGPARTGSARDGRFRDTTRGKLLE